MSGHMEVRVNSRGIRMNEICKRGFERQYRMFGVENMDVKLPAVDMEKVAAEHEEVHMQDNIMLSVEERRAEKRFLLKADLRIMTMVACVYLLSSLVSLVCLYSVSG